MTKNDAANKRFSLNEVPTDARWGGRHNFECFLCVGGVPIVVWMLMRVKRSGFFDSEGAPLTRVYVGGALPHQPDNAAVMRLLALGEDDSGTCYPSFNHPSRLTIPLRGCTGHRLCGKVHVKEEKGLR